MQGTPASMQDQPHYEDVIREVNDFFAERWEGLAEAGVKPEQIILDVGIGFGKALPHNLALLAGLDAFAKWQRPLLVGASRKGFIGQVTGVATARDRLPGSLACACWAVAAGANIIRTHDVAETKQAIRMTEALRANQQHD
jgi:dihydropteroate synthase